MRWSMVPLSAAAHSAVLFAILVNPIDGDLPPIAPMRAMQFVAASAVPPTVPMPRPPNTVVRSDAAPTEQPTGFRDDPPIAPEGPVSEFAIPLVGGGSPVGVPSGLTPTEVLPPPPVVQQRPTLVRPGGLISEPKKVATVPPVYPEVARRARIEGTVVIEAIIDERGFVTDARVMKSIPLLDAAVLSALKQWRYTPTLLNGVPVRVLMTITFNFQLDRVP
jgi:periplasmic protein TonB